MTELTERLFPVLETVPDGCITHFVADNAHYPHLRAGDWAVVDTANREIESGAVFLLDQMRCKTLWQINQVGPEWAKQIPQKDERVYWLNPLNKKTFEEALRESQYGDCPTVDTPLGPAPILDTYLSDGPIRESGLRESIVGRVVGVYQSPVEETPAKRASGSA